MSIKKLPASLINQISAGEVIERPASAIKELVDNSIDSGASKIQVQILSQDGRSFRVTDNGSGILPEELALAFTIHATSKIASLEDLSKLETKGFRGEALASILAVSEVTCLTKHFSANNAIKASFNEHGELTLSPVAFEKGTCLEINNLFGNTPARLKFLKRPETELHLIQDTIKELAIAHPEISFSLQIKNRKVLITTGSGEQIQAISEVLSEAAINYKYLEISHEEAPLMKLQGWIAPLSEARSDSRAIITLLNKRPIQCDVMRKAIKAVYQGFLPKGKHPRLVLSLTLPPTEFDVNVHPTKKEVRYSSPGVIYQLVQNSLEKQLILSSTNTNNTNQAVFANPPDEQSNLNLKPQTIPSPLIKESTKSISANFDQTDKAPIQITKPENFRSQTNKSSTHNSPAYQQQESQYLAKISELEIKKVKPNEEKAIKDFVSHRGNSSDFCLRQGSLYISGQIHGTKWLRESYLNCLAEWLFEVDLNQEQKLEPKTEQMQVLPKPVKTNTRRPIKNEILKEVWQRDNWRCVYCGKHLIKPQAAKKALRQAPANWIQINGRNNSLIKIHLFREHQASYDHYLPVKHNPAFSLQKDNLFACCRACNQAKSDSTDQNKWQVQRFPASPEKIKIGDLFFWQGDLVIENEPT